MGAFARWRRRRVLKRWANAHYEGGWAAYREDRDDLLDEVREARLTLDALLAHEGRAQAWDAVETDVDAHLLNTLSESVPRREDESDAAYDARLSAFGQVFRARLDGLGVALLTSAPPPRAARARVEETWDSKDSHAPKNHRPPRPSETKGSTYQWRDYAKALERETDRAA